MDKKTLAKIAGWSVAALTILATQGAFGKYSSIVLSLVGVLSGAGIHIASNTSAGHPNG